MESKRINLLFPLAGSSALILSYALIKPDSFEWITLIVPFAIASQIAAYKTGHPHMTSLVFSSVLATIIFVSFPTLFSLCMLFLLALKFHNTYQPDSISPRLLQKRNMSPFLFVSVATAKLLLHLLDLDFAYYSEISTYPMVENVLIILLTIGLFESILTESMKSYAPLRARIATSEKKWTNNVMTLLSHNIRTPIASLGNRVDIIKLKKNAGIEILDDDIEGLIEDRERVNSIVHSLLSKSSRSIISSKDTSESSINQALNDYVDRVKILKPEGVDFNLSSNDKIALELALESIISNSEKYGASQISIALDTHDNEVSITISDDGEGMDEVTLERYGTPFNSSKSKNGGSGLGVYFALQLVEDAGWQWSVDSELGKGTTVIIRIPKKLLFL